jgi:hypothetical protein
LPFLPVSKRAEFERFNKLMQDEFPKFDEKAMSLWWMDFVDGIEKVLQVLGKELLNPSNNGPGKRHCERIA